MAADAQWRYLAWTVAPRMLTGHAGGARAVVVSRMGGQPSAAVGYGTVPVWDMATTAVLLRDRRWTWLGRASPPIWSARHPVLSI
jgi:hypothetical protein